MLAGIIFEKLTRVSFRRLLEALIINKERKGGNSQNIIISIFVESFDSESFLYS